MNSIGLHHHTPQFEGKTRNLVKAGLVGLMALGGSGMVDTFALSRPVQAEAQTATKTDKVEKKSDQDNAITADGKLYKVHGNSILETPVDFWALKVKGQDHELIYRLTPNLNSSEKDSKTGTETEEAFNKRLEDMGDGATIRIIYEFSHDENELDLPWLTVKVLSVEKLANPLKTIKGTLRQVKLHPDLDTKVWILKDSAGNAFRLIKEDSYKTYKLEEELKALGEGAMINVQGSVVDRKPSANRTKLPWTTLKIEKLEKEQPAPVRSG